jgi:L-ascorbate metabolism protein UlaG (beta-lactamase superfamily)
MTAMFGTTFLGHQGWYFQSQTASFLVDPLLCADFGDLHALGYQVFPPRVFGPESFPRLDAVFLSHEHDDHFDIPSLAKLDRAIPIHLSARSSVAARRILTTMGFEVRPLVPGVPVTIGDLELVPSTGDHVANDCSDEWDTLPYLVRHTGGHGSFFTMVDITLTFEHLDWVKKHAPKPGLVTWTNNSLDWSHMADYLTARTEATQQSFVKMGVGHKMIMEKWGVPAAMMMCAGGFSFVGERAWLNDTVFCVDQEAVCNYMAALYKKEKFYAAVPGQTWWLENNKLKKVDREAPFLRTEAESTWPSRVKLARKSFPDYTPATGRTTLGDGELEALHVMLEQFAGAVVGTTLFKSLYSMMSADSLGRKPTFAFVLRDGDTTRTYEYSAPACAFVEGVADARNVYLAGFECWAPDLLAVLRGELGPIALSFGRARLWNAAPAKFSFAIFDDLYRMSHPLRRPAEQYAIYERTLRKQADVTPSIGKR